MTKSFGKRSDGVTTFHAVDVKSWREWLETYHAVEISVWLIIYHKKSTIPSVHYEEAVEHALCYGWIDSKPNKRDDTSYFLYFARRNPKSNWSKLNKQRIAKMELGGFMHPSGIQMVEIAKASGTWDALNEVEEGIIPSDLQASLNASPASLKHFLAFPFSVRRGILEWIFNAKRPATRAKRIRETVEKAAQNIRANQYRSS